MKITTSPPLTPKFSLSFDDMEQGCLYESDRDLKVMRVGRGHMITFRRDGVDILHIQPGGPRFYRRLERGAFVRLEQI